MRTRRLFLAAFAVSSLVLGLARVASPVGAAQSPQVPIAGSSIPQFVQPLPMLDIAGGPIHVVTGDHALTMQMCEFDANILPPGTFAKGEQPHTRVWGYVEGASCPAPGAVRESYLGPVVLATRGVPTQVTWVNNLPTGATTGVLAYKYSTDQTLHWADPDGLMCNRPDTVPEYESNCAQNYDGSIPAVAHLHGGEVPAEIDGGPNAWFTGTTGRNAGMTGAGYYTKNGTDAKNTAVYVYPNTQEAAPLWFHDHTLGATRLNVYAGLAGGYLLADPALTLPAGLWQYGLMNAGTPEPTVPLIIQDRMFDSNGQLYFPADSSGGTLNALNPEHPYWVPEFMGDTILVNGKAWPFLNVEPKRYRFLFLNGSNARTYGMQLVDPVSKNAGPPLWVIGSDGGYLDAAVKIDPLSSKPQQTRLLMMPGERYEVVVDFDKYTAGTTGPNGKKYSGKWVLTNNAKSPYPAGDTVQGTTIGKILEFRVGACASTCGSASTSYNPATSPTIRTGGQQIVRLANPALGTVAPGVTIDLTRELTLNEIALDPVTAVDPVTGETVDYPGGPLDVVLNNTSFDGRDKDQNCIAGSVSLGGSQSCVTERPEEGSTELWEIVNTTADAHPIHLHLTQFQIVNRQAYDTAKFWAAYSAAFPGGSFVPESGPPHAYNSTTKLGGNPDVATFLKGPVMAPEPKETGWKDTIMVLPGQVTRIVVRWAPSDLAVSSPKAALYYPFDPSSPDGYVWHCHIIDHEDSEMMRPDVIELNPDAPDVGDRSFVRGVDY